MPVNNQQVVCFGEILWDVLPAGTRPGGAPMNVAYNLHRLGLQPALITRIGHDERGQELLQLLGKEQLPVQYVQTDEAFPTGMVYGKPNERHEMQYDIAAPAAWDFIACTDALVRLVAGAGYFVFGSLAARNEASRATLLQLLPHAHTKVCDINLRPPHFSRDRVELLLQHCDVLKMNQEELELIAGWYNRPFKNLQEKALYLKERFSLREVIVTRGGDGALLFAGGQWWNHNGIAVEIADTVGAGDAFLAAYLYKTISGAPPQEALAFAGGLGALVASRSGAWADYDVQAVERLAASSKQQAIDPSGRP
jgi:fructokinase